MRGSPSSREVCVMPVNLRAVLALLLLFRSAAAWLPATPSKHGVSHTLSPARLHAVTLSVADEERLLLSEPAQNAFIVAEVRSFVEAAIETQHTAADVERATSADVDLVAAAARMAFRTAHREGILSSMSSLLAFFRVDFEREPLVAPLARAGLSPYGVAHHMTDMYHHLSFSGAPTRTAQPSGSGVTAARAAVGLSPVAEDTAEDCLVFSPLGTGNCLKTQADEDAFRTRRFERAQLEGNRDPRRGNSGSTR